MDRKKIEARRGIVRDESGKIIRSKDWLTTRIEWLQNKRADMKNRIKNIDAETKQRTDELGA